MFFITYEQQGAPVIEPFEAAFATNKFSVTKGSMNATQSQSNIFPGSWQDLQWPDLRQSLQQPDSRQDIQRPDSRLDLQQPDSRQDLQ